jgi:hypothetical protein
MDSEIVSEIARGIASEKFTLIYVSRETICDQMLNLKGFEIVSGA